MTDRQPTFLHSTPPASPKPASTSTVSRRWNPRPWQLLCLLWIGLLPTGCTSLFSPISGIPAGRLPAELLGESRADRVPIDFSLLRQDPPDEYRVDAEDVLGIYIEGYLPPHTVNFDNPTDPPPPPVNFPEDPNLPPALGFPIPIREGGTISLPGLGTMDQMCDLFTIDLIGTMELSDPTVNGYVRAEFDANNIPLSPLASFRKKAPNRWTVNDPTLRREFIIFGENNKMFVREISQTSDICIKGLTLNEIEDKIREAYTLYDRFPDSSENPDARIPSIIVTLLKRRTHRIIVVRQDAAGALGGLNAQVQELQFTRGGLQQARSEVVDLPAGENDILHALTVSGGLPGLDAKNEVKIYRGRFGDRAEFDLWLRKYNAIKAKDPCLCLPPAPDDPNILRIPLRVRPGEQPNITPSDVILEDGDILFIESREAEVYYTGGLLRGGEFPLPRDRDLDVLGAVSLAGQSIGANQGISAIVPMGGGVPPSQILIIRETPCNGSVVIEVDANQALVDPSQRVLVQPGDYIMLRYKPAEEITNFVLATFAIDAARRALGTN